MKRLSYLLFAAGISCSAAQITQFVNCGGATQSITTSLPAQNFAGVLRCNQNGVLAGSGDGNLLTFDVGARPYLADPKTPPGNVEASLSVTGNWLLVWDGNPSQPPAFWSFCSFATSGVGSPSGTGSGSLSGHFGPFAIGSPCGFADALPFSSTGSVTVNIVLALDAIGNYEVSYGAAPAFFDRSGNQLGNFGLIPLPDVQEPPGPSPVPEPSMGVPAAIVLLGCTLWRPARKFCRGASGTTGM
jgi:hypothetical protein